MNKKNDCSSFCELEFYKKGIKIMEKFIITKYIMTQKEIEKIITDSSMFQGSYITFDWNTDDRDSFVIITTEENQ